MTTINNISIVFFLVLGAAALIGAITGATHQLAIAGICLLMICALTADNSAKKLKQ